MKALKEQSVKARTGKVPSIFFLVLLLSLLFIACTQNIILVHVKVDPPKPDTTSIAPIAPLPIASSSDSEEPMQPVKKIYTKPIPPPIPDTTTIKLSGSGQIGSIQISGSTWQKISAAGNASIAGPKDEVLNTAQLVIEEHMDKEQSKAYYTLSANFQLNKNLKETILKITIPLESFGKTGEQISYLKFE